MPYRGDPPQCRIRVHLRLRPSAKPSPAIHIDEQKASVKIDVKKHSGGGIPRPYDDQIVFTFDSIIQVSRYFADFLFLGLALALGLGLGFPFTSLKSY